LFGYAILVQLIDTGVYILVSRVGQNLCTM